jgi:hypothetical protein
MTKRLCRSGTIIGSIITFYGSRCVEIIHTPPHTASSDDSSEEKVEQVELPPNSPVEIKSTPNPIIRSRSSFFPANTLDNKRNQIFRTKSLESFEKK